MTRTDGGKIMSDNAKTAAEQHNVIGYAASGKTLTRTTDPAAQWFFEKTNLGLFIHFGISAAGDDIDISWGMMDNPDRRAKGNGILTPNEYWALAEKFNPGHFEPKKWLSAAKNAGFSYAVFTTKHHDGYALWPSDFGDFSTKQYLGGRDLVAEYVSACRKVGLKIGLYYSPPDWRLNREYMSFMTGSRSEKYPERPHEDADHKPVDRIPEMPAAHKEMLVRYFNGQVRELLTRYGQIDLLWFDGTLPSLEGAMKIDEIRALQPQIIVNDRLWGTGDYCSRFECKLPTEKPDVPWETAQIWHVGGGWSYVKNADKYRAPEITLHQYEVAKKFGGNLLLNIAPDGDGVVPEAYYTALERLKNDIAAAENNCFPY